MTIDHAAQLLLGLLALIVICMMIALTATAIFRPSQLPVVVQLVRTIALAIIRRKNGNDPPTFPTQ